MNCSTLVAHSRAREVAGGEVDVQEPFPDFLVLGIELGALAQRLDGLGVPPLLRQLAGDVLQVAQRAADVSHLDARADRLHAAVVVFRVERSEPDLRLQRAAHVAAALAQLDERVQVRARVRVQLLRAEDVGDLRQRMFVIGLELEDLLVERAGFRHRAFVTEVVGDLDVLLDRLVGLARARVEIAERVLRGPVLRLVLDDADKFRDRGVDLALPDQLLCVTEGEGAIKGHWRIQSMVSNSVGGRNERRCASE